MILNIIINIIDFLSLTLHLHCPSSQFCFFSNLFIDFYEKPVSEEYAIIEQASANIAECVDSN